MHKMTYDFVMVSWNHEMYTPVQCFGKCTGMAEEVNGKTIGVGVVTACVKELLKQ